MLAKIKSYTAANPLAALAIAAAIGGVLALSFGIIRKLLSPAAKAVSKVTGGTAA